MFALALLLRAGAPSAVVALAGASVLADVVRRRHPWKIACNVGIYSLSQNVPQNIIVAALAIAAVPTVVVFLIFQRNIMAGLTAGGLKG